MDLGEIGKCIIASSIIEGVSEDNIHDILQWCEINNEKYTDRDFPTTFGSLSHLNSSSSKFKNWNKYAWIRISECFDSVEIFKNEVSPLDIVQGALGDCNFLCALSCLSEVPGAIEDLFVLKKQNEFGCYAVKICKDGVWKEVVIDDYVPCGNELKIPCFSQSIGGEVWVTVLEKVWAKVNGSYENAELTTLPQCLRDLTGAPTRIVHCSENMWEELVHSKERNSIICASASITKSSQKLLESMGLIGSLSYAVIQTADVGEKIVKLRNPWSKVEWNGSWSDTSDKWTSKLKKLLEFNQADDGKFWMGFDDFIYYFSFITICEITQGHLYTSIVGSHEKNSYCVIGIEVPNTAEYNIGVDQKDKLYMSTIEDYGYSCARVIICRDSRGSYEYCLGTRACERNLNSKVRLRKGKYLVFVMFDWEFNEREFVVSVYGPENVNLQVLGPVEGFLRNLYKNKAMNLEQYSTYDDKGIADCFKYHEMLPEGFGYYFILNNNSSFTLEETTYFKKFKNLILLPPYSGSKFSITVKPGCESIILLQVVSLDKYILDCSSTCFTKDLEEILIVE